MNDTHTARSRSASGVLFGIAILGLLAGPASAFTRTPSSGERGALTYRSLDPVPAVDGPTPAVTDNPYDPAIRKAGAREWWALSIQTSLQAFGDSGGVVGLTGNTAELGAMLGMPFGRSPSVYAAVGTRLAWTSIRGYAAATDFSAQAWGMSNTLELGVHWGDACGDNPLNVGRAVQLYGAVRVDWAWDDLELPTGDPLLGRDGRYGVSAGLGIRLSMCGLSGFVSTSLAPTVALMFDVHRGSPRNLLVVVDVLGVIRILLHGLLPHFV